MKSKSYIGVAVAAFVAAAGVNAADTPAASDMAKVIGLGGIGLAVSDIDRSTKFYTEILGLKVAYIVPDQKDPKNGKPLEVVFSTSGKLEPPLVVVTRAGKALDPGKVQFGRVLTSVPNAAAGDAIIARAKAAGYKMGGLMVEGEKHEMLADPDGYAIELFPADRAPKVP